MSESTSRSSSDGTARRPRVLFIGGMGRSGTTVVERLLNELPGTFSEGESIFLWKRGLLAGERCGCGEPFRQCAHWSAVGDAAFGGWDEVDIARMADAGVAVDRTRRVPALLARRDPASLSPDQRWYLDRLIRVMLASGEVAGDPPVLLDSSKHLSAAALLTMDPRLDIRVLHLIRDPRGVARSRMRAKQRPEAANVAMSTVSPQNTATRWVTDNLGYEGLAARGVPTLRLRYEDVMADPSASILDVARFAGLSPSAEDLAFLDGRHAHFTTTMHSAAGNPMRFGGDRMEIRADRGWQTDLDDRSRRLVSAISAPLMLRYGYPLRPVRPAPDVEALS